MSRIGNRAISLPAGVTLTITDDQIVAKGPKGELTSQLQPGVKVEVVDNQIKISRVGNTIQGRAWHGLVRSLVNNQVIGVTKGYTKTLKLIGTGYRAAAKGQGLTLSLGYSHPVEVAAEAGITFKLEGNDTIHIEGIDKQQVGQVAANIRRLRPPEPYKGKGIRYIDETVLRKQGKTAGK